MSEWTPTVGERVEVVSADPEMMEHARQTYTEKYVGKQGVIRKTDNSRYPFLVILDDGQDNWFKAIELTPVTAPAPEPAGDDSDLSPERARQIIEEELNIDEDLRGNWWNLVSTLRAEMAESATEASGLRQQLADLRAENARLAAERDRAQELLRKSEAVNDYYIKELNRVEGHLARYQGIPDDDNA